MAVRLLHTVGTHLIEVGRYQPLEFCNELWAKTISMSLPGSEKILMLCTIGWMQSFWHVISVWTDR